MIELLGFAAVTLALAGDPAATDYAAASRLAEAAVATPEGAAYHREFLVSSAKLTMGVLDSCLPGPLSKDLEFRAVVRIEPSGKISEAAIDHGGTVEDCFRRKVIGRRVPKPHAPAWEELHVTLRARTK